MELVKQRREGHASVAASVAGSIATDRQELKLAELQLLFQVHNAADFSLFASSKIGQNSGSACSAEPMQPVHLRGEFQKHSQQEWPFHSICTQYKSS